MKKWCEIKMYMQANPATLRQAITNRACRNRSLHRFLSCITCKVIFYFHTSG